MVKALHNNFWLLIMVIVSCLAMAYTTMAADDYTIVAEANKTVPHQFNYIALGVLLVVGVIVCTLPRWLWNRRQGRIAAMEASIALSREEARLEDERRGELNG